MLKLHPEILRKDGREQFVVLPYEEFVAVKAALEDIEDVLLLEEARREDKGAAGVPLDEVMKRFGVKPARSPRAPRRARKR